MSEYFKINRLMSWNFLAFLYLNIPNIVTESVKRTTMEYTSTAEKDGITIIINSH